MAANGQPNFSRLVSGGKTDKLTGAMTGIEIISLAAAGGAAGVMNAVAGGGTLITFPTLLFFGTPPITANATSTLALVMGTVGSAYGYRRPILEVKSWLRWFIPVSLAGGLCGAVLLTVISEKVFAKLVPFLILFATLLFLSQGAFRRFAGLQSEARPEHGPARGRLWAAILFQFFVALYGGYFGAGIGILMLGSLGYLGLTNIHQMNGLKTVLGASIKSVAAIYFIFSGLVSWPKMAIMMGGAVTGYFSGAHFAQRIPQRRVRQIITAIGFIISGLIFYREFGG